MEFIEEVIKMEYIVAAFLVIMTIGMIKFLLRLFGIIKNDG